MAISALSIVFVLILFLPLSCVSSKLNEKEDEYKKYTEKASELYQVLAEYSVLKNNFSKIEKSISKLGRDSLSGIVYNIAEENGIKKTNVNLKSVSLPSGELFTEIGKQVSIDNITFDQAIRLLDALVKYEELPLNIKKLNIKVDAKNKLIMKTVAFTLTSVQPNK